MMVRHTQQGYLLVLVLVFGAMFTAMVTSFVTYVISQKHLQDNQYQAQRATDIAEAGLNYYRWYLAHNPDDITAGTGSPGPYVFAYTEPEGSTSTPMGSFSLDISSTTACGDLQAINIFSTGYTADAPNVQREVYGRYARPTVAEYAYIINSNVWVGSDQVISGPYHSNGVVRMDGSNNSTVSSGQEDWTCDGSLPCGPAATGTTLDAVYGDGPNSTFWNFPVPPIDFNSISLDLADMQDKAENSGGVYIPTSGREGYRIVLKSDDTYDLYTVRQKENEPQGNAWGFYLNKIKNAQYEGNFAIPQDCPIIFVEDLLWLEGEVGSPVTIAAADIDTVGEDPSIILNDSITYGHSSSSLLAVAELDVLIGFEVPDDMELNGIFMAQEGHFGRNFYDEDDLPTAWDQYVMRNSLTVNGTIVSNDSVGTKWSCGGVYCSGFNYRYNYYDRDLVYNPPPLTPQTSDDYKFIEWREVE